MTSCVTFVEFQNPSELQFFHSQDELSNTYFIGFFSE